MQKFTPLKNRLDKIALFLDNFGILSGFLWQWTIALPSPTSHLAKFKWVTQTGAPYISRKSTGEGHCRLFKKSTVTVYISDGIVTTLWEITLNVATKPSQAFPLLVLSEHQKHRSEQNVVRFVSFFFETFVKFKKTMQHILWQSPCAVIYFLKKLLNYTLE